MIILHIILLLSIAIFVLAVISMYESNKKKAEIKEQREKSVHSLFPNAQIILNDGVNLFFKDDTQKVFGTDCSGKTYSYAGLQSVICYKDCVDLYHEYNCISIGASPRLDTLTAISEIDVDTICSEMLPIVKRNLYLYLKNHNIRPTHEYYHQGEIWGCDINSKKFYTTCASPQIYDFGELKKVTIEDLSNNRLCSANYLIHVVVRKEDDLTDFDDEYDLYFQAQDVLYFNFLSFFKGIKNRA